MAMSNQERIGKAMELLRAGLGPYVQREVQSAVASGALRMGNAFGGDHLGFVSDDLEVLTFAFRMYQDEFVVFGVAVKQ